MQYIRPSTIQATLWKVEPGRGWDFQKTKQSTTRLLGDFITIEEVVKRNEGFPYA